MKSFLAFRLDQQNHSLSRGQERLQITPKAFDVLCYLVDKAGFLVTQDELLEALWPQTFVNPEVLRKYILEIRRALGDRPEKPVFIETVTKRGYRFIAPVTDESAAQPEVLTSQDEPQERPGLQTRPSDQEISSHNAILRKLAISMLLLVTAASTVAGYFWHLRNKQEAPPPDNSSIAVLPFTDLSPGKDQEYFSDGLTEELISNLAQIPGLKVVARSSAFQFKGKNEDLRTVGQKLGVATVLEGSVRKDGNNVRITAELTKTNDGFQLWSETYAREATHIFTTQDEIAHDVSKALQLKLLRADVPGRRTVAPTTNPDTYQAYLLGQYFVARGQDREDLTKALTYSEQATKLDPNYAPAWAQQSQVLERLASVALMDGAEGYRRARESAQKAVALDPQLASGYLALALVQVNHDRDWAGAEASLKKAGLLEPGSAAVFGARAYLARILGRVEEAIGLYQQAIALDPLRADYHLGLGYELYVGGRNGEASAALQKAQELNPQLSALHLAFGENLLAKGQWQAALEEMEKETGEWEKLTGQVLAYYAVGQRGESDKALKKLIATHQSDAAYQIAEGYAYRGEVDKAFAWLDRAYQQRDPGTPEFKTDPLMKSLRQDPRFAEFLQKMNLPLA